VRQQGCFFGPCEEPAAQKTLPSAAAGKKISAMDSWERCRKGLPGGWSILAGALLAAFATASAKAAPSRHAQERAARRACLVGDYAKGVELLSDLFVATEDPTYIFNQGRCFEQSRRYEDAIGRFQEYLRAGKHLDASGRAETEKHIADCQELLAKQTAQPVVPPVRPPSPTPSVQEAPSALAPSPAPVPVLVGQPASAPSGSGAGMRTAGIITAAVGGAAVIGGIILNLKANSMASDMEAKPGAYSTGKESDRKTLEALGWVGYGVGAACIATGTILYAVGLKAMPGESGRVALLPAFGPGQAGAMLKGAF